MSDEIDGTWTVVLRPMTQTYTRESLVTVHVPYSRAKTTNQALCEVMKLAPDYFMHSIQFYVDA
jgi:hypothetical protein